MNLASLQINYANVRGEACFVKIILADKGCSLNYGAQPNHAPMSEAIFPSRRSSSSPSSVCSGSAAGDNLQSQQRRPQLGQSLLSSDLTDGFAGRVVRGLMVGDLGVGDFGG